ncbi:hypothetical protein CP533_5176 [Ophiocordyceps camponoti-saundersi (nom. inval.)]|nr:hypothetical protein CP533_5176 [Ophiocordyceps camponoti-saundersi (nom. inval.)]
MTAEDKPRPPIAIIGMGMRLPGGISTAEGLWDLIINKKDGKCRVPKDRYNVDAFYGEKLHRQKVASDQGYFLADLNLKSFDATFFSMSRTEVASLDPQQRLLLEVVWECMENAGQTNWRGTNIGCYAGVFGEDWAGIAASEPQEIRLGHILGFGDFAISNRISYDMTIRTACSSSLICLHEACQALYNGECSSAIVAGTNIIIGPSMTLYMSAQGVLSSTGSSLTFDAKADGYARGEAVNAVLIKLLDNAVRDGDPIRAVIRSTSANCDGKTPGMMVPNPESQERMIRRAYKLAGIDDVCQTAFVECHGTGTQLGDSMEGICVANVFGERGVYIGSVKPNLGHAEGASGITSIIKATLALEHEIIPPNIKFSEPNPKIPFEKGKLQVPLEPIPWPADRHARVSVNSFGIGGSNAHVILESAASFGLSRPGRARDYQQLNGKTNGHLNGETNGHLNGKTNGRAVTESDSRRVETDRNWPFLIPVSAKNEESLRMRMQALNLYADKHPHCLDSIAYTMASRRDHLPYRTFSITSHEEKPLEFEPFRRAGAGQPPVVLVFTGQGAQWSGMGKDLFHSTPSFAEDIRKLDGVLQRLPEPPEWTIEGKLSQVLFIVESVLCLDDAEESIHKSEFAQPVSTALQIALVNLLGKCGGIPSAIIGHSSGEIAGAYAAGALTMTEAILVAFYRGLAMKKQTRKGGMAAIGLGRDHVLPYLVNGTIIACENSPQSVTIAGDEEALEHTVLAIQLKHPNALTKRLRVDMAYHSHHMYEVGEKYQKALEDHILSDKKAFHPFYSSVTGKRVAGTIMFGPSYWRQNLQSPVLFSTAVTALLNDISNDVVFLEIGPHSALQGPLRQIFQAHHARSLSYIPTLIRGANSTLSLLKAIGRLYTQGVMVNFSFVNPPAPILTDLPNYDWDHRLEFWYEGHASRALRQKKFPYHELLGSRCLESSDSEPSWRHTLYSSDLPWLKDHRIGIDIVYPAAAFVAMLGEVIRQLTGCTTYSLRKVVIKTALILHESEGIDIMTTARPSRLTDNANSSWYDVTVSSFNGTSWLQHCVGQAKGGEEIVSTRISLPQDAYPRAVPEGPWYDRMSRVGMKYGPFFRGLRKISAHPRKLVASGRLRNDENDHDSIYAVHPIAIDLFFQLFGVAQANGVGRNFMSTIVPSYVNLICIRPGGPELVAEAAAEVEPGGSLKCDGSVLTEAGDEVISLKGGYFAKLESQDEAGNLDTLAAARLVWQPDIDFVNPASLLRNLDVQDRGWKLLNEKVCALALLRSLDAFESTTVPDNYLAKLASWLASERQRMAEGKWSLLVPEAQEWASQDAETRRPIFDSITESSKGIHGNLTLSFCHIFRNISDEKNIHDMCRGRVNPLQLLMEHDFLGLSYDLSARGNVDQKEFFSLYSHAQPTLKILEIGGGTGSTTMVILESLMSEDGARMYSEYTFTDISSAFFTPAKERFSQYTGLSYQVLDITKDPSEQGFQPGSYDLVIAANVLHATPCLSSSLRNVRSLLRPGGRLYIQELVNTSNWKFAKFIPSFLPGWWLGEDDNRLTAPIISVERWDQELRSAGFSGTDAAVLDDEYVYHEQAFMISTVTTDDPGTHKTEASVTFLYYEKKHDFARELAGRFATDGIRVSWSKLTDQDLKPDQDVVSTLDLENPFFYDISEDDWHSFIDFLSKLRASILWLTRPAQFCCRDPRYGSTLGLARTIRTELMLDFVTLEIDTLDHTAADAAIGVFKKHKRASPSTDFDCESEFALHNGVVHIGRYHWITARKELEGPRREDGRKCLDIDRYGSIQSLHWVWRGLARPKAGEVEVHIHYTGLNFRDVLQAMGLVAGPKSKFGLEATGIVTAVGTEVGHVKVGDHVIMVEDDCMATRRVVSGKYVARIPDSASLEEAATMILPFATVFHAVVDLAQLRKDQSILIHSACGGVGLAAIQICRSIEAEIYVTVGSEEKVQFLMDNFGIARTNIFNSRSNSFLSDIMRATDNRGVDLVLNSLSGELLHASWECVAAYGKFIEIGKRDLFGRGQLALKPFLQNRTFYGIDIFQLFKERPDQIQEMLQRLARYIEHGEIKPIRPIHVFSADQAEEAFRFMQKGKHIGKIVVRMPQESEQLAAVPAPRETKLSCQHTYLLVGGLGGIGKSLATWMTDHGARSFVFLSRSAGQSSEDQAFIQELESQGCRVTAVAGSVAEFSDVRRAAAAAPTQIKGVIHLSMVLRDTPLLQMSHSRWNDVQSPKVKGAWNLHNAGLNNLDFFILFSSISAVYGPPGQANYASANTFLDSFVQYRHSLGLPCSVIDLGATDEVGFLSLSENAKIRTRLKEIGQHFLQEQDMLDAVDISINRSHSPKPPPSDLSHGFTSMGQLVTGLKSPKLMSDPMNMLQWKRDIRIGFYRQLESADAADKSSDNDALRDLLNAAARDASILDEPLRQGIITKEIARTLCSFMLLDEKALQLTTDFATLGIDSLVSIEIRNWWQRVFGVEISVLEIVNAGTVKRLGEVAVALLKKKYEAE